MNTKFKRIFDITLAVVIVSGTIYLCNKYIPKIAKSIDTAHKEAVAKRQLEEKLLKENMERFAEVKTAFRNEFNDSNIAKLTLSNKDIATKEDRAYLYEKLRSERDKILTIEYRDEEMFERLVNTFADKVNSTKKLDKDSLDAMLLAMHNADSVEAAKAKQKAMEQAEALKHQRELEIIEEKKNKELAVLKAKAEAENAKFKTVCETMKDAEKKVQANVNVKTDLEV